MFSTCKASPQTIILLNDVHGISECFVQQHDIPHSIAAVHQTYFIFKELWLWAHKGDYIFYVWAAGSTLEYLLLQTFLQLK